MARWHVARLLLVPVVVAGVLVGLPGLTRSAIASSDYGQLQEGSVSDGWTFSTFYDPSHDQQPEAATNCTAGSPSWYSADASDLISGSTAAAVSDCVRVKSGPDSENGGATYQVDINLWCGSTEQSYAYFGWAPNSTDSLNTDSTLTECSDTNYLSKLQIVDHSTGQVYAEWDSSAPPPSSAYEQMQSGGTSDGWQPITFSASTGDVQPEAAANCVPGSPNWYSGNASDLIIGSTSDAVTDCFRVESGPDSENGGANYHVNINMWCGSSEQSYGYFGWAPNSTKSMNTDTTLTGCQGSDYLSKLQIVDHSTGQVYAEWDASSGPSTTVSLASSSAFLATGETANLTATTNLVMQSGDVMEVYDGNGDRVCLQHSGPVMTCSVSWSATPVTYTAFVASAATSSPPTGSTELVDPSPALTVQPLPWQVTLSVDHSVIDTSQTAVLTATANQEVAGSGYQLQIFDVTTGDQVCNEATSASFDCTVDWTSEPQVYVAYVATAGTADPPPDAQALSNSVAVEPKTGAPSVYYTVHNWNAENPADIVYDIAAAGQGLAGSDDGPCSTDECTWTMTVSYTASDATQQVLTIGSGTIDAGQDTFSTDETGTLDLAGASSIYLTLSLIPATPLADLVSGGSVAGALSSDVLDGIDVEAEFAQIVANYDASGEDPCDNLLVIPGSHAETTSTSDEYNDCEIATDGGAQELTVSALDGLVAQYGPALSIDIAGTLTQQVNAPADQPSELTVTPDSDSVNNLAQVLIGQSQGKMSNEADAEIAAQDCLSGVAEAEGSLPEDVSCNSTPIFFPGSDNPAPTANDWDNLFDGANTVDQVPQLAHMLVQRKPPSRSRWYRSYKNCSTPLAGKSCDEYPFGSTRAFDGTDFPHDGVSLAMVPVGQNSSEGGLLSSFYNRCGIAQGQQFLVIPMTGSAAPNTTYTCGEAS